jgi:hypothetical protein
LKDENFKKSIIQEAPEQWKNYDVVLRDYWFKKN